MSERSLIRFQFYCIFQGSACGPACESWRMFQVHLGRLCILLLSEGMLYKYQLSLSGLMCHLRPVFLLIFCLDDMSIDKIGVLQSPSIIESLYISPFMAVNICLIYWGDAILSSYIFTIVIPSSWINPLNVYIVSFLLSFNSLYFKVYFVWYDYCYSSFLLASIFM